jgi:uncharacterized protein (TIGR03437 family)
MRFRSVRFRLLIPLSLALGAAALLRAADSVPFDNSGNSFLKGDYNFRQLVGIPGSDNTGDLSSAYAIYGTITFDGNGNYTTNGSIWKSSGGQTSLQAFNTTGTYSISASGLGYLSSTLGSSAAGIFGLVSQGIFIGSSTEDNAYDLFIAMPARSGLGNGDFTGSYWAAEMNFPSSKLSQAREGFFQLNPDGGGNLGTVSVSGYIGNGNKITQSLASSRYSLSGGGGTLTFGSPSSGQPLINTSQTLYISPDGNLIFGGSSQGFDMLVGVRVLSDPPTSSKFSGLYYQAGMDLDESTLSQGYATLDAYYGALAAVGVSGLKGVTVNHQRLNSPAEVSAYDYTYSDPYQLAADGSYDDYLGIHYILGSGGLRLGFGQQGFLGVHLGVKAPSFSGSGVYINPAGVVNGGSSAPFTVGVSPGALMTLYGTGLADSTVVDSTFPVILGGVQVMINGRAAPIYVVSPTQISVLVPWATSGSVASIQVVNKNVPSNTVTVFISRTTPGVFTVPPGGVGPAAALHPDGSLVSDSNPAKPGETVAVFLTGLGSVQPAISDGAVGPTNPLSQAVNPTGAAVGGSQADVVYAGLAPLLRGLYQMNITIPSDAASGAQYLDVAGPDAYTSEAWISVGAGTTASAAEGMAPRSAANSNRLRIRRSGKRPGAVRTPGPRGSLATGNPIVP